jgi:rubredoxin
MTLVVAYDDIGPDRIRRNPGGNGAPASTNYRFFGSNPAEPDSPSAFLAQYPPDDNSTAHYHVVDQFQILVRGKGEIGRHKVEPYYVHFARAYTPYGPLHAHADTGWTFMTLRARFDPGAQRLPGKLPKLKEIPDRKPWQVTTQAVFPEVATGAAFRDMAEVSDERGLFARAFTLAPGAVAQAPSPASGDGQYVVALEGSLMHDGAEKKGMAVIFLQPDEPAFEMKAGPEGCRGIILNFPKTARPAAEAKPAGTAGAFKKWQCVLCAFFYDEELGLPEEGIPPGTRWADVPETWNCPDCAAGKSDFEMVEVA